MEEKNLSPEKLSFRIYIVESPNPMDLYQGRCEGKMLLELLKLDSIPCSYFLTADKKLFIDALSLKKVLYETFSENTLPILHISCHGDEKGIELTSGEKISWNELKEIILPLNSKLHGNLLLCLSSCKGANACIMAMEVDGELPFFAVIGNDEEVFWSDTAIGYATFYHLIKKGYYIAKAKEAMCQASGNDKFKLILSKHAKEAYIDAINKRNMRAILDECAEYIRKNFPVDNPK